MTILFPLICVSYHSLLAVEDSFLDKDQTVILAEVEASGGEADLVVVVVVVAAAAAAAAAAVDLARAVPGQGYLVPEGLP